MAKEIDKIIQSKTAPKSNNVLWDDGESLKINRNGKWESTSKESSSNQELYAYPVDSLDGKENKVVGLGGDALYNYVGEMNGVEIPNVSEGILSEAFYTEYRYQIKQQDKYVSNFMNITQYDYITLYIGNDVDGYCSSKIYISESNDNLNWQTFEFIPSLGPRNVEIAIDTNYTVHYRNYMHHAARNSKVFFANCKQQLDVNLIPQEIARKEDISPEVIKSITNYNNSMCLSDFVNYVAENGNITYGLSVITGELGSKSLVINGYVNDITIQFSYDKEDETYFYYSSDVADIKIWKTSQLLGPYNLSVHRYYLTPHKHVFSIGYDKNDDTFDFSRIQTTQGFEVFDAINIRGFKIYFDYWGNDVIIDSPYFLGLTYESDVYSVFLKNKYIEFKIQESSEIEENTETQKISLEVTKEIDILSLESRLAALEAKLNS